MSPEGAPKSALTKLEASSASARRAI